MIRCQREHAPTQRPSNCPLLSPLSQAGWSQRSSLASLCTWKSYWRTILLCNANWMHCTVSHCLQCQLQPARSCRLFCFGPSNWLVVSILLIVVTTEVEGLALFEGQHCSHSPHCFGSQDAACGGARSTLFAEVPPQRHQGDAEAERTCYKEVSSRLAILYYPTQSIQNTSLKPLLQLPGTEYMTL